MNVAAQTNKLLSSIIFFLSLFFFFFLFQNQYQTFAHNSACTDVDDQCNISTPGTCGGIGCSASAPPGLCNWKWGNRTDTGTCINTTTGQSYGPNSCSRDVMCCCSGQAAGACACNVTCSGSSTRPSPSCVGASGWDVYACTSGSVCDGNSGQVCYAGSPPSNKTAYYCQSPTTYQCNTSTKTCSVAPETGCVDNPPGSCSTDSSVCNAVCDPPVAYACSVSASSVNTTTIRGTVTESGDNQTVYDRFNWYIDGSYKGTNTGPTADFNVAENSNHTISAGAYASNGSMPTKSCGSASVGTGGTACYVGKPCSSSANCNGGWCNGGACSTCAPGVCTTSFSNEQASCAADGTITASAVPDAAMDYLNFNIFDGATRLCRSGEAGWLGDPPTDKRKSWDTKGCGSIGIGSPLDYSWGVLSGAHTSYFNSALLRRDKNYEIELALRYGNLWRNCSYSVSCNSGAAVVTTQDATCETTSGTLPKLTWKNITCNANFQLSMDFDALSQAANPIAYSQVTIKYPQYATTGDDVQKTICTVNSSTQTSNNGCTISPNTGNSYLYQNFLSNNRVSDWNRACRIIPGGGIDWASCPTWSNYDLRTTGIGGGTATFRGRSDFVIRENGVDYLYQNLINNADLHTDWNRKCAINSAGVNWSTCTAWGAYNLNLEVPAPNLFISRSDYVIPESGVNYLYQTLLGSNGYSNWWRRCAINAAGINWGTCTAWGAPADLRTLGAGIPANTLFIARTDIVTLESGIYKLTQHLIPTGGLSEYYKVCTINAAGVNWATCPSWIAYPFTPLYASGITNGTPLISRSDFAVYNTGNNKGYSFDAPNLTLINGSPNKTFKGTAGKQYTVEISGQTASGGCSDVTSLTVNCAIPSPTPIPIRTVSGQIYIDRDHDNIKDANETAGYTRKTVTINAKNITTLASFNGTFTQSTGNYSIPNLAAGTYDITVYTPTDGTSPNQNTYKFSANCTGAGCETKAVRRVTITTVNLTNIDFGLTPFHKITGTVRKDGGLHSTSSTPNYNITSSTGEAFEYTGSGTYRFAKILSSSTARSQTLNLTTSAQNYSVVLPNPKLTTVGYSGGAYLDYSSNYTVDFNIQINKYTVTGNVFLDTDGDGIKDAGETNSGVGSISSGGEGTVSNASGSYTVSNLTYLTNPTTITYTVPSGYVKTYPPNGVPNPSYNISVGSTCSVSPDRIGDPACSSGNVIGAHFGIQRIIPAWFQGQGGDMRDDYGFSDDIPAIASPYASIPRTQGGTAGIVFSGDSTAYFGTNGGKASVSDWVVGSGTNPETFSPKDGTIKTSYDYVTNVLSQAGITPTNLGCTTCAITSALTNGVYIVNTNLTISSATFAAAKNYVILVNGNLTINGNITVPIGSTATFIVNGQITVASGVTGIDGIFSADRDFIIQGVASCPTTADVALNVKGAIIANAELSAFNYSINNNRSLCAGNETTPVYTLTERPDFLLNLPQLIRVKNRVWQEAVP